MATRSRQYEDWQVRYNADHTSVEATGTTDINTGFIILPPWVADKIELAGGDLVDFFYGNDVPKVSTVTPAGVLVGMVDTCVATRLELDALLPSSTSRIDRRNSPQTLDYSCDESHELNMQHREAAANKVRKYLSEEDIADIGLLHYLLSDALHLVNPLSGLCHSHEYTALLPLRNRYMTDTVADGRFCTLGQVVIHNADAYDKVPICDHDFTYDVIRGNVDIDARGLWFTYDQAEGVPLDGICKYAYERITSICENTPERVNRSGGVAKVYGDKGSIVCVPNMATVLNVADMLSRFAPDDDIKRQKVEGFNSSKERLLALIECIVTERRRWVGTHGCARDGLMVLYTRQL